MEPGSLTRAELSAAVSGEGWRIILADLCTRAAAASVENSRLISARLRELGLTPEPAAAQTAEIAIDALDIPAVMPFWRAVLGYVDESDRAIIDPAGKGPAFWVLADPEGNEACVCTWQARD
jgi:4a-hydroxytetrahydrobiopterin dehydratase